MYKHTHASKATTLR